MRLEHGLRWISMLLTGKEIPWITQPNRWRKYRHYTVNLTLCCVCAILKVEEELAVNWFLPTNPFTEEQNAVRSSRKLWRILQEK